MAGFAEKERGDTGVQWGNVIAGAGMTGGVLLAGTAVGGMLGVDILEDAMRAVEEVGEAAFGNADSVQEAAKAAGEQVTEAATQNAEQVTEQVAEAAADIAEPVSLIPTEAVSFIDVAGSDFMDHIKAAEFSDDLLGRLVDTHQTVEEFKYNIAAGAANIVQSGTSGIYNFAADITDTLALDALDKIKNIDVTGVTDVASPSSPIDAAEAFDLIGISNDAASNARDDFSNFIAKVNLLPDQYANRIMDLVPDALTRSVENNTALNETTKAALIDQIEQFDMDALRDIAVNSQTPGDVLSQLELNILPNHYGEITGVGLATDTVDASAELANAAPPAEVQKPVGNLTKYGMLGTGAALAGGGYAYQKTHPNAVPYDADIDYARMENAKMGFAAKEQTRALKALIAARQQAFSPEAADQGQSVG